MLLHWSYHSLVLSHHYSLRNWCINVSDLTIISVFCWAFHVVPLMWVRVSLQASSLRSLTDADAGGSAFTLCPSKPMNHPSPTRGRPSDLSPLRAPCSGSPVGPEWLKAEVGHLTTLFLVYVSQNRFGQPGYSLKLTIICWKIKLLYL